MSSLDVMLLVSSQLDTYIAEECKMGDGGTLSANAFEFWHARYPSGVAIGVGAGGVTGGSPGHFQDLGVNPPLSAVI